MPLGPCQVKVGAPHVSAQKRLRIRTCDARRKNFSASSQAYPYPRGFHSKPQKVDRRLAEGWAALPEGAKVRKLTEVSRIGRLLSLTTTEGNSGNGCSGLNIHTHNDIRDSL
jgi:hypothetical protein